METLSVVGARRVRPSRENGGSHYCRRVQQLRPSLRRSDVSSSIVFREATVEDADAMVPQ